MIYLKLKKLFAGTLIATAFGLAASSAQADLKIGAVVFANDPMGEEIVQGTEKAVADINASGGIRGEKLTLMVDDAACDPKKAVTVAESMASKGAVFVAGHLCSGSSIAASEVYKREGILQISPASTSPILTDRGFDNVYRVCGRDDQQGALAGNYLADNFGDKKIAVVHDKRVYSRGLADATKAQLNRRGVNETLYDTIDPHQTDYSALVAKLKQMKIDVLYYGGHAPEAGLILQQLHAQGKSIQLISGDALAGEEFWTVAGSTGEGTLVTFGPDPRKNPAAADVVESFRNAGYEPEGYTLYGYAAIQVWAQAARKASSLAIDDITAVLNNNIFKTVLGDLTFNSKGDIEQSAYIWYEWSNGKLTEK